jgi:small conductance mechanosensitive channel
VFVALLVLNSVVPRAVRLGTERRLAGKPAEEIEQRVDTLTHVFTRSGTVLLLVLGFFTTLPELGINIAPLLAGVGVVGIAIGFGAQTMVRDFLAGLFILMDNQYGKGDVVRVADISGLVEDVGLRRTVLRDLDGIVHYVPNGEIKVASNFTQEYSRVNLNVEVSYEEDLDRVTDVINRVGQEMAKDPAWAGVLLTPPIVLRVDNLGDSGVELKIVGDTQPIRQWDVMGELRKRIKKAFDEEGIEIPYPHRVMVQPRASPSGADPSQPQAGQEEDGE